MISNFKSAIKKLDYIIIIIITIFLCIGIYCIRQVGIFDEDKEGLFIKQLLGAAIGFLTIFAVLFIDYHFICNLSFFMYIGILFILAILLKFGDSINNVKRWITIAGIPFQPSELAKIILIMFLAFLCNYYKNKLNKLYVFFIMACVTALPIILIILEPHLSACMSLLFIFCVMVYMSGINYKVILTVLALVLPIVLGIVISITVFQVELPFIKSYQIERILSFMSTDESEDIAGKYQQNQAAIAIASGGLHGKMISNDNSDRIYKGIYANESDFIFSVVSEEFGFIGTGFIVLLYLLLFIRCFMIAAHAPDYVGKMICFGVSGLLMFQVFVNIGVTTGLLPNTGLALPFISYGLTSLISSMLGIGLVLNIGIRQKVVNTQIKTITL